MEEIIEETEVVKEDNSFFAHVDEVLPESYELKLKNFKITIFPSWRDWVISRAELPSNADISYTGGSRKVDLAQVVVYRPR